MSSLADRVKGFPRWLGEVDGLVPVNSQFILTGNVRDKHLLGGEEGEVVRRSTIDSLWACLERSGYEAMAVYDPVDYLRVLPEGDVAARDTMSAAVGASLAETTPVSLTRLGDFLQAVVTCRAHRLAFVLDYASRLVADPQHLSEEEWAFFVRAEKLSHSAQPLYQRGVRAGLLYNCVVWVANRDRDLPSWLAAGNETIRTVPVPLPDLDDRARMAGLLLPSMPGAGEGTGPGADRFAEQTEGMTLRAMEDVARLSIDRSVGVDQIEDAVRCYRVGMLDNPWKRPKVRERIAGGQEMLCRRVRGQERAVARITDILARSTLGLTGAHASGHAARPRGIVFFAGPTGVGKTELAKAVTELVFGDEEAYTRFDMSEFSAEHSDARLVGAPPGYVGHDAGGELTNAVRQRPFSLVLFDEVEKAHPRILDKFLQILEDGRLTDAMGRTVHFSETILVFTSNLGIYVEDDRGRRVLNCHPAMPTAELEGRVLDAIRRHFTETLNRPELLNRIGDNIVVFDFIRQAVADELVDMFTTNILRRVKKEVGTEVTLDDEVAALYHDRATADLSFGGRGIGAFLETALVNPLARALFETGSGVGAQCKVVKATCEGGEWAVALA
ncbi:MAG: AAA family ATPase [Acidimicrobiales bacterium]